MWEIQCHKPSQFHNLYRCLLHYPKWWLCGIGFPTSSAHIYTYQYHGVIICIDTDIEFNTNIYICKLCIVPNYCIINIIQNQYQHIISILPYIYLRLFIAYPFIIHDISIYRLILTHYIYIYTYGNSRIKDILMAYDVYIYMYIYIYQTPRTLDLHRLYIYITYHTYIHRST